MSYKYADILLPELYEDDYHIRAFIEDLLQVDVDTVSDDLSMSYLESLMPLDAAVSELQSVSHQAKLRFEDQGVFMPFFSFRGEFGQPLTVEMSIPTTEEELTNLVTFGKALAFCTASQISLFSSIFYHDDDHISRDIGAESSIGVCTTGNCIRGTRLQILSNITVNEETAEVQFEEVSSRVARSLDDAPLSKFHHIEDKEELSAMVGHIPIILHEFTELSKEDVLINFAVTLKTINRFSDPV